MQRVAVGAHDRHAVLAVAERELPEAVVPMKLPLSWLLVAPLVMSTPLPSLPEIRFPCGGRTKTLGGRVVAAGRLAADEVRARAWRDEDAVPCVAAAERAGGIGADDIHGDPGCRSQP